MSADAVILADGDFPRAGGEARLILERARRVADWLETEPLADTNRLAVVGLSRLGKTALWAGATDERFAMVCPTCSGLFGARMATRNLGYYGNTPWATMSARSGFVLVVR
jgi:hypothetical protein